MYLLKVHKDAGEQEAKQHFEGPMEGLDLWSDLEIQKLEEHK